MPAIKGGASSGQILVAVLVALLIAATLVPLMVFYTQKESQWTAAQAQSTAAFHLAEAGVEKGYLGLSLSTANWVALVNHGTPITDYHLDKEYTDLQGGTYAISITSGPQANEATIISVARDSLNRRTRAIKAVYASSPLGGIAIYSGGGAQVGGGVTVEWGAVVSPASLTLSGATTSTYPQLWSAGSIDVYKTNSTPPNCGPGGTLGCCQWHAYASNIPPTPLIDLNFYKSSATATLSATSGCWGGGVAGSCYYNSSIAESGGGQTDGSPAYVDGTLSLSSPGIAVVGSLIVTGNLTTASGNFGKGNGSMPVPQLAWKQYCNNWSHYQSFDGGAPAAWPGLNSAYTSASSLTYGGASGKIAVWGLLYVGGYMSTGGGGGNSAIYGAMYVVQTTTMTNSSGVTFYYNDAAAANIQMSQLILSRVSWQDYLYAWPSNLP